MRRRYDMVYGRERPSPKKLKTILVLALGVYLLAITGIYFIGEHIEKNKEATATYGTLEGRFEQPITMEHEGDSHTYHKQNFTTILLLGIDQQTMQDSSTVVRGSGQADFLMLVCFDRVNRKVIPIHLDRDTIGTVQVYGVFGNPAGYREMQICLAYAFGDTPDSGCMNTVQAVSKLFGGIHIDHYLAMDMNGMAILNDALGGIEVTLEEDFSDLDPAMTAGATLQLTGRQAEYYLRGRLNIGDGTNQSRMRRQRVFMEAAIVRLNENMEHDANYAEELFDLLNPHLCTSAEQGWFANLLYSTSKYERISIQEIAGEHTLGLDGFVEFYPDADALKVLTFDTFFE
ncbi:MAG: LCP family protein [Clostridia bacterium]|nr:LCP family protein [Clostridia bacterium]